ncbi:MAG: hypothetical protein LBQ38_01770 [Spirochaetaceae bacterium]|jgi:hypothetical protein|nr:hypothetical protein [Spirochaetaceae bacterium]
MKRFFGYSFQGKIPFSILLCMTVFFAVTWYLVRYVSRDILLREKGDKLLGYTYVLANLLGPRSYDDILRSSDTESASWEKKIQILNEELREITEQVANASSGLGIGFYCRSLDAIVTYGMVRGNIMNAMLPLERKGEVIGYMWANELTTDNDLLDISNAIAGNDKMFLENGFQDFLSKPIDTIKLDAILRTWLLGKGCVWKLSGIS